MSIMYWLAVGFAGILVLGGLGLVVYMIIGGKSDTDTPSLVSMDSSSKQEENSENSPEQPAKSVFSLPGVETVDMREERARPAQPSRREMRERSPRSTRKAKPLTRAPISARNAAPKRASDFQELDPNAESALPKPAEKPRRSFDWNEEEI